MAVAANAILNVIFIGFFKLIHWEAEHMALALASTGSAMVNAGLLYFICINAIFSVLAHTGKNLYAIHVCQCGDDCSLGLCTELVQW